MVFLSRDAQGLQLKHPEVAGDYLSGMTYLQIADKYGLVGSFRRGGKDWAVSVVGVAIRGMKDGRHLEGFKGLLPEEVWRKIGRKRSLDNLEKWVRANDGMTGFALLSDDERGDILLAAMDGRGQTSISVDEARLTHELSQQEEYRNSHGALWGDVAEVVNHEKHDGKNVRTSKAIKSMAYKYRKGGFS